MTHGALHLENAARSLRGILARRDPEHVYIVSVRPVERDDAAQRPAAAPVKRPPSKGT